MRKLTTRITAMLLAGMLVLGSVPGSVLAASTDVDPGQTSEIAEEVFTEDTSEAPEAGGETSEIEDTFEEPVAAGESYPEEAFVEETAAQYYTVTLDANGGYFENEWDDSIGDYAQKAEVINKLVPVDGTVAAFPIFTDPDGQAMLFAGWSLERDGELVVQAEEEYVPVDNCVLYAVWRAEDAALVETGEQEVADEDTELADTIQESDDAAVPEDNSDSNVEAYTVTLDANGGYFVNEWDDTLNESVERIEILNKVIPAGETVKNIVPIMDQENAAAAFLGWSLEPDGEVVSLAEEEYIPGENCVLYAVWEIEAREETEGSETTLPGTYAEESAQDETNEDVQDENSEAIQEDSQDETNEDVQEENPTEFAAEGETAQEDYSQETVVEEETAQEEDSLEQVVEEEITQEEDSLNAEVSQESEESSGTDEGSEATDGASQDDQTVITEEDDQQEIVSSNPVYTNLGDGTPEDFEANSVPISIGVNNVDVSVEEGSLYKFVPNEDDIYTFYSEGEYDTIGSLFGEIDGDMYALAVDDNSGADNNFSTSYELEEGKTYYLAVIFADYESGSQCGQNKIFGTLSIHSAQI